MKETLMQDIADGISHQISMNNYTKCSVEYKTLCLVMWIATGNRYYIKEGHSNGEQFGSSKKRSGLRSEQINSSQ